MRFLTTPKDGADGRFESVSLPECAPGKQSGRDSETDGSPGQHQVDTEVARELCLRAEGRAILPGHRQPGSEYVLGLKAVNCQTGDAMVEEQVTANRKEKVLNLWRSNFEVA